MAQFKRWLTALLCPVLALSCLTPAWAETGFASVYLEASAMAFPQRTLHVEVYRRGDTDRFAPSDTVRYTCQVNQVSGDASLEILTNRDGIQLTVDYLTDMDQNGVYELLDGQDVPTADCMTLSNRLAPLRTSTPRTLNSGSSCILTAQTLAARGEAALSARSPGGSYPMSDSTNNGTIDPRSILYLVTLHGSDANGGMLEISYYFQIYDKVILPADVPLNSWFRPGAEYALERGFLSGTAPDTFSPSGSVTRSQLAQILWRLGGSEHAGDCGYTDVPSAAWFYQAVNWCCQTGLMSGTEDQFLPDRALTREELAVTLQSFARNEGKQLTGRRSLEEFTDGASVSQWARDGVEWAAAAGFLSGYDDGSLRPGNGITRAELAAVMRKYCLDLNL